MRLSITFKGDERTVMQLNDTEYQRFRDSVMSEQKWFFADNQMININEIIKTEIK